MPDAAVAEIEVAWVLAEEDGEDGAAEERAGSGIGLVGAEAFEVAGGALVIAGKLVGGLLDASGDAGDGESCGIDDAAEGELQLLSFGERRGGASYR